MEPWFNLEDVHRAKQLRQSYSTYRERIVRTYAAHVRHLHPRSGGPTGGRRKYICVVDKTGLHKLLGELVDEVDFTPMAVPLRFKDAVRTQMLGPDTFTTGGLEPMPQVLDRAQFLAFLRDRDYLVERFLEEDFENI